MQSLDEKYHYEEGPGIESLQNKGGFLKSYFVTERANGESAFKPWQKEGEGIHKEPSSPRLQKGHSGSIGNLLEGLNPEQKKKFQSVTLDHDDVRFSVNSPNHLKMGPEGIEKEHLTKSAFSPPMSPSNQNIQKQLVKTPLPFPRLSATFNFTYGMSLNDALMRDAMKASNDNQLVRLMQEKKIKKEYFFNPPLHWFSLNFLPEKEKEDKNTENDEENEADYGGKLKKEQPEDIETKYREEGMKGFKLNPKVTTFASPKVHFFFDVLTAVISLVILIVGCCLYLYGREFRLGFKVVMPICVVIIAVIFIYQCLRFIPSKYPRNISNCAASQMEREFSDTGMMIINSFMTEVPMLCLGYG